MTPRATEAWNSMVGSLEAWYGMVGSLEVGSLEVCEGAPGHNLHLDYAV